MPFGFKHVSALSMRLAKYIFQFTTTVHPKQMTKLRRIATGLTT